MFAGENTSLLGPPTVIRWSEEITEVGAAEPGYEEYVVVNV